MAFLSVLSENRVSCSVSSKFTDGMAHSISSNSPSPRITCAPRSNNPKQPMARSLSSDPGSAYTSRQKSFARYAVINAPDFFGASMTIAARLNPAMMRLRWGKCARSGLVPAGYSLTTNPLSKIFSYKRRLLDGYTTSTPVPNTAMVRRPACKHA